MAKKIPSRKPSAKAQRVSSSSVARSGNSVRKKSGESKEHESSLSVRTPKESKLRFLLDAGIIVPEEIPSDEDSIPLDFTRLSNKGIGQLHSRYAVRHAHVIFNAAKLAADAATLKRELRMEKAKFRIRHRGEKKNIVDAMMEDEDTITDIEDKLLEVDAKVDLLAAVAIGYETIRNAASREIARRMGERAAID